MTMAIMRRLLVVLGALLLVIGGATRLGAWLAAQGAGGATVIDFRAVGADGAPVTDLKASEVTVRVAGRPRPVTSLRLVQMPSGGGAPAAGGAVPPPFGTNVGGAAASGGRTVLIVIEDESLPPGGEPPVRQAVTSFLDTLSPSDRVSLAIAPRDTANAGFNAGMAKIRSALEQTSGRRQANPSSDDEACRTRDTLLQLRSMLAPLSGAETPATVLFFSSRLSVPPSRTATQVSGGCDLTTEHYQNLGATVAAARAQFFVINSDNAVAQRSEGLETLASVTGAGTVQRLVGQPDLLTKIAAEASSYYLATIEGEQSDRGGQTQRLEIRVSRDGVTPKFRPEVMLSRTAAAPGAKPAAAPGNARDMLRETRAFTDLGVRTVGVASRDAGGRIKVTVFSEPVEPGVKLTSGAIALIDASGKFAPTTLEDKQLSASPIVTAHSVAPGKYRLRFAAIDASGRAGAADYEVDASLTDAGPLKMSGLMLVGPAANNAFSPRMLFRDEAAAGAYLEIYGQLTGQVSARMEIASSIDGPAINTVQPGGQQTNEPDKFMITGQIPIAALAPGDYVVRAFVAIQGQPEGRVIATLRKVAK